MRKHGPSGQMKQRPSPLQADSIAGAAVGQGGHRWLVLPRLRKCPLTLVPLRDRSWRAGISAPWGPVPQPVITALHPACLPPPPGVAAFRAVSQACFTVCVCGCVYVDVCGCACVCECVCVWMCVDVCVCVCVDELRLCCLYLLSHNTLTSTHPPQICCSVVPTPGSSRRGVSRFFLPGRQCSCDPASSKTPSSSSCTGTAAQGLTVGQWWKDEIGRVPGILLGLRCQGTALGNALCRGSQPGPLEREESQ